jgi:XTP/dITP diphosphohydrolase
MNLKINYNLKEEKETKKLIYLTSNPHKVEEANEFFGKKYGFNLEIKNPDFEVIEIQAKTCEEVVKFSVKYAADKLGCAVLKSDSGLYIDALGGLPGPYNAYFDKQIGIEKFLELFKNEANRKARIEHCFGYCEPGKDPIIFKGGGTGTISYEAKGERGRWHDKFYIPNGETKTLSELREIDYEKEASYWGTAKDDFAKWFINNNNE